VLLAVPSFDPQATFARLSAEELREDPGDRLVALIGRHLPALLHHRGLVAVGLIALGLAKLVAAAAMWEGQEWGGYLLAATVALLLPFDLRPAPGRGRPHLGSCSAGRGERGCLGGAGAAPAGLAARSADHRPTQPSLGALLMGVHWMAACIARRELRFGGEAAGWFP